MLFFIFLTIILGWVENEVQKVHIIPHSHCDTGYRKTTIGYFYDEVKEILDNTIAYLSTHPEAKNIWVETLFLKMWWDQAETSQKNDLLRLIHDTNQIEIVMGGFVMNDQACVTYISSINQMTHGHLWHELNTRAKPNEGFTIDPFGETSVQAYLYKEMGFKYHIINRIQIEIKESDRAKRSLETFWQFNEGQGGSIFTHLLYLHYDPPDPDLFSFWLPTAVPVTPLTVKGYADVLLEHLQLRSKAFLSSKDLMIPYGGDFAYTCPKKIYGNMTCLMDYMNSNSPYNESFHLIYSTPGEYLSSVSSDPTLTFPKNNEAEYFVYDSSPERFWSGYFTSQPMLKLKSREGQRVERTADQLHVLGVLYDSQATTMISDLESIYLLRWKNAQIQHHDAITGTCKAEVAVFYEAEMETALTAAQTTTEKTLGSFLSSELYVKYGSYLQWSRDGYRYVVSENYVNPGDKIGFVLYNSLGWAREGPSVVPIHFYVDEKQECVSVVITDRSGKTVYNTSQTIPILDDSYQKKVLFDAPSIPPVGMKLFVMNIQSCSSSDVFEEEEEVITTVEERNSVGDDLFIENDVYKIHFDPNSHRIDQITNKISGVSESVSVDHMIYKSKVNLRHKATDSDAYAFSPSDPNPEPVTSGNIEILNVLKNDFVEEVVQKFSDWLIVTIRLYKKSSVNSYDHLDGKTKYNKQVEFTPFTIQNFFEFEYDRIGVIPRNQELILKFRTFLKNDRVIYHDSMALKTMKKEYKNDTKYAVQANYYPVQFKGYITAENSDGQDVRLVMMTNKAQGISSQNDGEFEAMLHRRPAGEFITEFPYLDDLYTMKNNFKMRFILDDDSSGSARSQVVDEEMIRQSYYLNYPLDFFSFDNRLWKGVEWESGYAIRDEFSFMKNDEEMSPQIHLLSLKRIMDETTNEDYIIRVNNLYENPGESAKVDVDQLFQKEFSYIQEYSLSLMYYSDDTKQLKDTNVNLLPLEIKTYKANF